jgi:hypothetical protein
VSFGVTVTVTPHAGCNQSGDQLYVIITTYINTPFHFVICIYALTACLRRTWWPYCYLPNPGPCTYTLPSNRIRLRLVHATWWNLEGQGPRTDSPVNLDAIGAPPSEDAGADNGPFRGFEANFTAHFDKEPRPFLDGDCRLKAPNANHVFKG